MPGILKPRWVLCTLYSAASTKITSQVAAFALGVGAYYGSSFRGLGSLVLSFGFRRLEVEGLHLNPGP